MRRVTEDLHLGDRRLLCVFRNGTRHHDEGASVLPGCGGWRRERRTRKGLDKGHLGLHLKYCSPIGEGRGRGPSDSLVWDGGSGPKSGFPATGGVGEEEGVPDSKRVCGGWSFTYIKGGRK